MFWFWFLLCLYFFRSDLTFLSSRRCGALVLWCSFCSFCSFGVLVLFSFFFSLLRSFSSSGFASSSSFRSGSGRVFSVLCSGVSLGFEFFGVRRSGVRCLVFWCSGVSFCSGVLHSGVLVFGLLLVGVSLGFWLPGVLVFFLFSCPFCSAFFAKGREAVSPDE